MLSAPQARSYLLLGSWQPCPAIGELKTVIEILLRLSTQPSNLTSMATKRGRPVVMARTPTRSSLSTSMTLCHASLESWSLDAWLRVSQTSQ